MVKAVRNFGGNVEFKPRNFYRPKSEQEVLDILSKHKGGTIRARGSMHAWSEGIVSDDAFLDLDLLNSVSITKDDNGPMVRIGGGCKIFKVIAELKRQNLTLPTVGAITQQSIAGAVSTATHGSGSHSISEFAEVIRIAAYDQNDNPKMFEFKKGDPEFPAAQCSVGCMGIIVEIAIRPIPRYAVEEYVYACTTIQQVLSKEKEFPLQSFALFPYSWKYYAWDRRKTDDSTGVKSLRSKWNRFYDYLTVQIGANATIRLIARFLPKSLSHRIIPVMYSTIMPAFMSEKRFMSDSEEGLMLHTSHHYAFQHLEMEVFIPEKAIEEAAEHIKQLISLAADRSYVLSPKTKELLARVNMDKEASAFAGSYQHHYPLFFRTILPDSGYIAMSQGGRYYSVSFFTFLNPSDQQPFYDFGVFVARVMARGFSARLHWGKFFPLGYEEIRGLFPEMKAFQDCCSKFDKAGTFRNGYTERVLGLSKVRT